MDRHHTDELKGFMQLAILLFKMSYAEKVSSPFFDTNTQRV